jgi:hypothetical protein
MALRRAAIGLLRTLLDRRWDLSLSEAVAAAHAGFEGVRLDLGAAETVGKLGGRLAGALLDAGLVDRLYWVQSPLWLGEGGRPAVAGHESLALAQAPRWRIVERRALGEDTLLVADRT